MNDREMQEEIDKRDRQKEKVVELIESLGFYGGDASLAESLFCYGLIVRKEKATDEYAIVYVTQWEGADEPKLFDVSFMSRKEILDIVEYSWFDIKAVLSYTGLSREGFMEGDIVNIITDMISFYGCENIFGSSYYPMDYECLINWLTKVKAKEDENEN